MVELGIGVAENCRPVVKRGDTIGTRSPIHFTGSQLSAKAAFVQQIQFIKNDLTCLTGDVPILLKPSIDMECEPDRPKILWDCNASGIHTYPPGTMSIGLKTTDEAFKTTTFGFREKSGKKKTISGAGDVVVDTNMLSAFLIHSTVVNQSGASGENTSTTKLLHVEYFEYTNRNHLHSLLNESRRYRRNMWRITKSEVSRSNFTCFQNNITAQHANLALRAFRTVQAENDFANRKSSNFSKALPKIKVVDIIRAILVIKLVCHPDPEGQYKEFTTCTTYDWRYLMPLAANIVCLFVLGVYAKEVERRRSSRVRALDTT